MDIEQARKMARIKAREAAPLWGILPEAISRHCNRGDIPGAAKVGKHWYVTPAGMDLMFSGKKKKR